MGISGQGILNTATINSILLVGRFRIHVFPKALQLNYHPIGEEQAQTSQHALHPRRRRHYYYRLAGVLFRFSKRNTVSLDRTQLPPHTCTCVPDFPRPTLTLT